MAAAVGAFQFSRPEDVATDPADPTRFVLASTGRGQLFPSDNWGTTYIVDVDFSDLTATLDIVYDGDDAGAGQFADPDFGLRSPDNLDRADDGMIYVQEDRSTAPRLALGGTSGIEASVWMLDPATAGSRGSARSTARRFPRASRFPTLGSIGVSETPACST